MDCRHKYPKIEGLFSKMTIEWVWHDLDRKSHDEWLRKGWANSAGRNRTKAAGDHGRREGFLSGYFGENG